MKFINIKVNGLKGIGMRGKFIIMWKNIGLDRGCLINIVLFFNLDFYLYLLKIIRNNIIWNIFGRKKFFLWIKIYLR